MLIPISQNVVATKIIYSWLEAKKSNFILKSNHN